VLDHPHEMEERRELLACLCSLQLVVGEHTAGERVKHDLFTGSITSNKGMFGSPC
jgi:hypothetical protein